MTSPALFVLSLALVCSICGIASERAADHDSTNKMRIFNLDVTMDGHGANHFNRNYSKHNEILDKTALKSKDNEILDRIPLRSKSKGILDVTALTSKSYDTFFEENDIDVRSIHKMNSKRYNSRKGTELKNTGDNIIAIKGRTKREINDPKCDSFKLESGHIMHPHNIHSPNKDYYNNTNCVFILQAPIGSIIKLTFIDIFRIEYHPQCIYDYLEVRDGKFGFAKLIAKVCGQAFPQQMVTTGPYAWLKFHSDDTIEYEGFKILVEYKVEPLSHTIPESCYKTFENQKKGVIEKTGIAPECIAGSINQALDVMWTIKTTEEYKIYLNFTNYELKKPNECEDNVIQVFGSVVELESKLDEFCGSVASSVTTKDPEGNIMHVRFFASQTSKNSTFRATFNSFRMLNQAIEGDKCGDDEFDCEDNSCIDISLACDSEAHCRLKADEEISHCLRKTSSEIEKTHILVILVIFSLILSSMSFVFLFKCIRKLYQDHKAIKEHLRRSTEDRLDGIEGSRLTLDPQKLSRDSEPRASLERENQTNEMYKRKRSSSKHKQSSIDSDYIIETQLEFEDEPWRREVDSMPIEAEDIRIERNGRTRRSDLSKKEESMRSRTKESEDTKEKKEIRDVSVGAPDTKESACQTRESLFQADPPPSSDGSGTNSRGFSTFGFSGATIARRSPPASTNTSEIKIELVKPKPSMESKPQKKVDRRPISTETTRSAPDVIIVSKPIR